MIRNTKNDDLLPSLDWIDITLPVRSGMVTWPTDIPVRIERTSAIEHGDENNNSEMHMGVHTGTHMDAPLHFLDKHKSVDQLSFNTVIGPARVIEISDTESIKPNELYQHNIQCGERILFKTRNSQDCWRTDNFTEDYIFISKEAASYLVDCGVVVVGIDYLSVAGFKYDAAATHIILLGAEIWIIEGLDLSSVSAGNYELICLPLRLMQTDGSPARAILCKQSGKP